MQVNKSFDPEEAVTIVTNFIKTYVDNSGCDGVVVGLSGGIDSAVTSILCQKAIGTKKTKCIFLPDETTPKIDKKHQETIVKTFKLKCESLVCGSTNKSEILVGYFTKYGDGGVDIMPIGDIYKTQVLDVARYLKIPEEIIEKPPTAGLIKDQTDEKELKISYQLLDQILYGLELKMEPLHIAEVVGSTQKEVLRIQNLRIKSQHKRRTPLIPKIGLRTPGLDWRSPIQTG
jgi:NAD+ synthase